MSVEKPPPGDYQAYLKYRLDRRVQTVSDRADKVYKNFVERLTIKEKNTQEDDRLWLDQFANGYGLDICCGDFLVGGEDQAIGVDGAATMVGTDFLYSGDDLTFQPSDGLDFIVSNYFDAMPAPLKALNEYNRSLKSGGALALICSDAEFHHPNNPMGALKNARKVSTYSKITLGHYMSRAHFDNIKVETTEHGTLRAVGYKV